MDDAERGWGSAQPGKGAQELLDAGEGAGGEDYVVWLPGKAEHRLP